MPFSFNTTIASGSTDTVAVTFAYLDKSHVHVKLNAVQMDDADFTWDTDSQIRLPSAPQIGTAIRVYRNTPKDEPAVVWETPSIFDGDRMNRSAIQLLYIAQEAYDLGTIPQEELDAAVFFVNQTANNAQASADLAAAQVTLAQAKVDLAAAQVALAVTAKEAAEAARDAAVVISGFDPDDFLLKAGNLSGLADLPTSRTNLGVYSITEVDALAGAAVQYTAQTPTTPQKIQGRANLGAAAVGANTFTAEQQAPSFYATGYLVTFGYGGVAGQGMLAFNAASGTSARGLTYGVGGDYYNFLNAHAYSAAGRLYGTNDFSTVASAVRLSYAGDAPPSNTSLEPYPGAACVGVDSGLNSRYRYVQYQVGGSWYTAGLA